MKYNYRPVNNAFGGVRIHSVSMQKSYFGNPGNPNNFLPDSGHQARPEDHRVLPSWLGGQHKEIEDLKRSFIPGLHSAELGNVSLTKISQKPSINIVKKDTMKDSRFASGFNPDDYVADEDFDPAVVDQHFVSQETLQKSNISMIASSQKKSITVLKEDADTFESQIFEAVIKSYKPRKDADDTPVVPLNNYYSIQEEDENLDEDAYGNEDLLNSLPAQQVQSFTSFNDSNSIPPNQSNAHQEQIKSELLSHLGLADPNPRINAINISDDLGTTLIDDTEYNNDFLESMKPTNNNTSNNQLVSQKASNNNMMQASNNISNNNMMQASNNISNNNMMKASNNTSNNNKAPVAVSRRISKNLGINDSLRGGKNNWMIKSFIPQGGFNYEPKKNLKMSVAFVGQSNMFNSIVGKIKGKDTKYKDKDFPAEFDSLWGFGESRAYNMATWKSYKWATPDQIYRGEDYTVYEEPLSPNDIMQGQLGDCYFLSAIAAIGEWKNRIKKLFLTRDISPHGIFCVALCINGMWEEVVMDD